MTNIGGVGRAKLLQTKIVKAIHKLQDLDEHSFLPNDIVRTVFGDLLEDPVISAEIKKVKDNKT